MISEILIDDDIVNELFSVKNMTLDEFAQSFVDNYNWIDSLEGMVKHNDQFKEIGKWYIPTKPC